MRLQRIDKILLVALFIFGIAGASVFSYDQGMKSISYNLLVKYCKQTDSNGAADSGKEICDRFCNAMAAKKLQDVNFSLSRG
jgi:hypothetical protein